ncbi:hypothetical protein [Streptomyces sp. A5-4]|uniref:hypothetical protein n=1 Tax=Streptomyces sp. A5-4 TaxID=3384771 RepID=UPI003DA87601
MFRESIAHAGGTTEGTASESHALLTLRRAARRGYAIEATRDGGALITWTRREIRGGIVHRSITFIPQMPVGTLTEAVIRDLTDISELRPVEYTENDYGRRIILAGLTEISPMATAALRARKLVTADERGKVRLTLTARLGLLAAAHRTTTTEPDGWTRASDSRLVTVGLNRPGRRAGMVRQSASAASCSCGQFRAFGGDRAEARTLARGHQHDVGAAFVAGLSVGFTDAVTAEPTAREVGLEDRRYWADAYDRE